MRSFENFVPTPVPPSTSENISEKPRSVIDRIRGRNREDRVERNRYLRGSYEHNLHESKQRIKDRNLDELEELMNTPDEGHSPEALEMRENLCEEFPELEHTLEEIENAPTIEEAQELAADYNNTQTGDDNALGAEIDRYVYHINGYEIIAVVREDNDPANPAGRDVRLRVNPIGSEVRASRDAVEYMYGKRLAERLRMGSEISPEQADFLRKDLIKNGLESALGDLHAQRHGFASFQQAGRELKIKSGIYADNEKFLKVPDRVFESLPPSVQNAIKSAKFGAVTTAGLATIALFAPAIIPAAAATATGVVGATLFRMGAGYFARDRNIYKAAKKGEKSTSQKAFDEMAKQLEEARLMAHDAELNIGKVPEADREKAMQKVLNEIVKKSLNTELGAIDEYREKANRARKIEAAAGMAGGIIGGMAGSYAATRIDALMNGISLDLDGDGIAHTIDHIKDGWHFQVDDNQISSAIEHGNKLSFFDASNVNDVGQVFPGTPEVIRAAGEPIYHAPALQGFFGGVEGTIAMNSIMPGLLGGSLAGIGSEYRAIRKEDNKNYIMDRSREGLTTLFDDNPEVTRYKLPWEKKDTAKPAAAAGAEAGGAAGAEQPEEETQEPEEEVVPSYDHLTEDQVRAIRKNADSLVLRTNSPQIIRDLFDGERVQDGSMESPKTINALLGFEHLKLSRDQFLEVLPSALQCLTDRLDELQRANLIEIELERLGAVRNYSHELLDLATEGTFANTLASVQEHIIYAKREPEIRYNLSRVEDPAVAGDRNQVAQRMGWNDAFAPGPGGIARLRNAKQRASEAMTVVKLKAAEIAVDNDRKRTLNQLYNTLSEIKNFFANGERVQVERAEAEAEERRNQQQNQGGGRGRNRR